MDTSRCMYPPPKTPEAATDRAVIYATTFEWHCRKCDKRTWTTGAGGALKGPCLNGEPCTSSDLDVYRMFLCDGDREYMGTAADLEPPREKVAA